jgi:hypothetical protein
MLRRHILAGGAGLLLPAGALARCPSPVLELEGTGAGADRIAVFGQAFQPGDLPQGAGMAAQLADGTTLPCQLDVKTRHPDGSARHAVVAMRCPALADGARAPAVLVTAPPLRGEVPLPSGRSAMLHLRSADEEWTLDLLRAMPGALSRDPWQRGPLAVQGRVMQQVPLRGLASLRVVADVALRADGTLWVEAWFRNDLAMGRSGGAAAYAVRLLLDGRQVLAAGIPHQHHYTGWGRLAGTARPPPRIRHGATYLADAAAVPRYGVARGVEERVLARMAAAMRGPGWDVPLAPRGITQNMYQGGARADIGPATQPQAAWLVSADRRAEAFSVGQAEAAGAIPWHFWDAAAGRWMDTARWPRLWSDPRGGRPPGGLAQPVPSDTGWRPDVAHQPDLSFVPYLLTGRRAFLDNLQAQAAASVLAQWPRRRGEPGQHPGGSVNVVNGNQVRGTAWSLRQLENAAWATPEADPHLPWLRGAAAGNWAWMVAEMPGWTRAQGEAHGRIPGVYGVIGVTPPWQQDHFASTAALAARRGSAQAREVLAWAANFLVGRFHAGPRGFQPHDGCAYVIATGAPAPLQSWAEIGAATRAAGLSNGDGWARSRGDYPQWALASLAAVSDALDLPAAREAYDWLRRANPPFTRDADYRRDPTLNIVPRERC